MLSFSFYPQAGEPIIIDVSEVHYEKLAHAGLGHIVRSASYEIIVEEDKYEIEAIKLNFYNRRSILNLLESERHNELKALFNDAKDSEDIFTIPGNVERLIYVKLLTVLYVRIIVETCAFFSYE